MAAANFDQPFLHRMANNKLSVAVTFGGNDLTAPALTQFMLPSAMCGHYLSPLCHMDIFFIERGFMGNSESISFGMFAGLPPTFGVPTSLCGLSLHGIKQR